APNQSLDCSFGDMAPGASVSVHITSATTKDSAGTYPNTATASATNTGSVHDDATIVVLAPDLSITKTADAQSVSANDRIGFTITVSNAGPGIARSATLNDPLPQTAGTNWSIDPAYAGQGTCAIASNVLTCAFGDLLSGGSASVHVSSATTSATCGPVDNTA